MAASTTKRTAPAKRAPAKAAPAKAPAKAPAAKADEVIADDPRAGRELKQGEAWITLPVGEANRDMVIVIPGPAQLAVWPRTIERLQRVSDPGKLGGDEAVKLLGRALSLIESVLVDEDDKFWIEDQLLQGRMELQDAAQVLVLAAEQFRKLRGNQAPTTGPQPKARRRR